MPTVNVRQFDGTDDVIRVSSPAHFTSYTWAAVLKRDAVNFHSPLTIGGAGAASPYLTVTYDNGTFLEMRHGGGPATEETENWSSTTVHLVVITHTAGSPPRFHRLFDGGSMIHQAPDSDSSANPADWTVESDDEMRFGNWNSSFNFWNGSMAVQALWVGTDVSTNGSTDAAVEALAGGDRDDWQTAGADHLWEFDQASAATALTDYIGSLDQIGITGTTVTTLDVPSSLYSFASAPSAVGRMRSRPLIRV